MVFVFITAGCDLNFHCSSFHDSLLFFAYVILYFVFDASVFALVIKY